MILSDQTRLLILAGMWALLTLIEGVLPLFQYRRSRMRRAMPNIGLTILVVITNFGLSFAPIAFSDFIGRHRFGLLYTAEIPAWMQFLAGVVLLDLCAYLAHLL